MPGPRLEAAIGSALARARLLERAAYDPGPWSAAVHGCCRLHVPLRRFETVDDRIILTGYLRTPCSHITAVELWCGPELAAAWPADPPRDSPLRITVDLAIPDVERAA